MIRGAFKMGKSVNRRAVKKPAGSSNKSDGHTKARTIGKKKASGHRWLLWGSIVAALVLIAVCTLYVLRYTSTPENIMKRNAGPAEQAGRAKAKESEGKAKVKKAPNKTPGGRNQPKDFKISIQGELTMNNILSNGQQLNISELTHNNSKSSVRAYVIENFLSKQECDGLMSVHSRHTSTLAKQDPIICFDGMDSFRKHLKDAKLTYKVSARDFTEGTTCVNETFSSKLKPYFRWSYSTAFYPGESKFSTVFAEKIQQATGLKLVNGGKFQITSYPLNVGYKSHTDCVVYEKNPEKRDRFATILVYLRDVEGGGETQFPHLGLSVKPQKGLALVWNSMNEHGECDPLSLHKASRVTKGQKFILQRWYYYENFFALGKRPPQPALPARKPDQPRVSCDEYEQGSCRWYDEWNYDHIIDYASNTRNLV